MCKELRMRWTRCADEDSEPRSAASVSSESIRTVTGPADAASAPECVRCTNHQEEMVVCAPVSTAIKSVSAGLVHAPPNPGTFLVQSMSTTLPPPPARFSASTKCDSGCSTRKTTRVPMPTSRIWCSNGYGVWDRSCWRRSNRDLSLALRTSGRCSNEEEDEEPAIACFALRCFHLVLRRSTIGSKSWAPADGTCWYTSKAPKHHLKYLKLTIQ